ncbi:MAG: PLP-dependent aminotransferase family protein [Acidovorax sp.]
MTPEAVPLYRRLAADYRQAVERGQLQVGERLPSVRALMRRHGVSLSTALQTLRCLEDQGQIEARPRVGYFVRGAQPEGLAQAREPDLRRPLTPVRQKRHAGINERISLLLERGWQAQVRVDLGGATPPPALFDREFIHRTATRILREQPDVLVQGRSLLGTHPDFQRAMARRALAAGMGIAPGEVLSTTGNSEAVSLALAAVAAPGDVVAVESPTYYGLLQVIESLQMQALEIPCSPRTGLSLEALELALRTQPRLKAVVVVPELQMPLGTCMPDTHKARLVELCTAHGVALIEDDSYSLFVEGERSPRPLKHWDTAGQVIYCEAFNKSLAPGLRQGWMNAGQWHGRVQMLKFAQSRHTQPLAQLLAAACVGAPAHVRNLQRLKQQLRRQREAMARLVARWFPLGTRLSLPPGGLCLWLEFPEGMRTAELFTLALAQGIRTAPGGMFSNTGRYERCMRLGCTHPVDEAVEQACRTLGALAHRLLGQPPRG